MPYNAVRKILWGPFFGNYIGKEIHIEFPADLVAFTEEILYGKLHFLCSENHPYFGKSITINFLGSPHRMGFAACSHAVGCWWKYPFISLGMAYTIGYNGSTLTLEKLRVPIS